MTSIEWLGFHLNSKLFDKVTSEEWEVINEIFKIAHKLHQQENIDFAKHCLDRALDLDIRTAYSNVEKYYKETFKK